MIDKTEFRLWMGALLFVMASSAALVSGTISDVCASPADDLQTLTDDLSQTRSDLLELTSNTNRQTSALLTTNDLQTQAIGNLNERLSIHQQFLVRLRDAR